MPDHPTVLMDDDRESAASIALLCLGLDSDVKTACTTLGVDVSRVHIRPPQRQPRGDFQ